MNRLMYDAFDRFLTPFRKLHSNYSREIFFSLIQQIKLQLLITNYLRKPRKFLCEQFINILIFSQDQK